MRLDLSNSQYVLQRDGTAAIQIVTASRLEERSTIRYMARDVSYSCSECRATDAVGTHPLAALLNAKQMGWDHGSHLLSLGSVADLRCSPMLVSSPDSGGIDGAVSQLGGVMNAPGCPASQDLCPTG